MAERTLTICDVDDRDGSVVGSDVHIHITIGRDAYDADLCRKHADELFSAVESFIAKSAGRRRGGRKAAAPAKRAARKTTKATAKAAGRTPAKRGPGRPRKSASASAEAVRAWARDNGITVSDRGRLSKTLLDQYTAAQSS